MWLLDANMDVHLSNLLREFGIPAETTKRRGWQALSIGDLVREAVQAGFHCLLTRDRLFGASASTALKAFPRFAVVVLAMNHGSLSRADAAHAYS